MDIATMPQESKEKIRELLDSIKEEKAVTIMVKVKNGPQGVRHIFLENKGIRKLDDVEKDLKGNALVSKTGTVKWKVISRDIERILILPKEEGQVNIWDMSDSNGFDWVNQEWEGKVKNNREEPIEWNYSLYFKLKDEPVDVIDPIIRVNK